MCTVVLRADPILDTLAAFNGDNGAEPGALVQIDDGTIYGTTNRGGKSDLGTIFVMTPGQPMATLVTFVGNNGSHPSPRLVIASNGYIYGTTKEGGTSGGGTVYRFSHGGSFETVASFDASTGNSPQPDLIITNNGRIYGSTARGGSHDGGTLFEIDADHKIKTLVDFSEETGVCPQGLSQSKNGMIYGSTATGGANKSGTIFSLTPDGKFATISSFNATEAGVQHSRFSESAKGIFYGTSFNGGENNLGTVYAITPDGIVRHIQSFREDTGTHPGPDLVEWNDGYFYMHQLMKNMQLKGSGEQWMGANICGTTSTGGEYGNGTIFRVTDNGGLVPLISFTGVHGKNPGTSPNSLMTGADGNLYGTTGWGGTANKGTIFRLSLPSWTVAANGAPNNLYKPVPPNGIPGLVHLPIVSY